MPQITKPHSHHHAMKDALRAGNGTYRKLMTDGTYMSTHTHTHTHTPAQSPIATLEAQKPGTVPWTGTGRSWHPFHPCHGPAFLRARSQKLAQRHLTARRVQITHEHLQTTLPGSPKSCEKLGNYSTTTRSRSINKAQRTE